MNECANGCADLAVGRASGAEGFRRKCVTLRQPDVDGSDGWFSHLDVGSSLGG